MKFLLFLWWWGLLSSGAVVAVAQSPRSVDFLSEHITMQVSQDTVTIRGSYIFRNRSTQSMKFRVDFPFHVDEFSEYPFEVGAFVVEAADTLEIDVQVSAARNSAQLDIPLQANSEVEWHLLYRQQIRSAYARYVLTSTGEWGRPLQTATYRFVLPAHYEKIVTWPETTLMESHNGWRVLECTRRDFLPERDMVAMWQVPLDAK